jgi:hypothetical protein
MKCTKVYEFTIVSDTVTRQGSLMIEANDPLGMYSDLGQTLGEIAEQCIDHIMNVTATVVGYLRDDDELPVTQLSVELFGIELNETTLKFHLHFGWVHPDWEQKLQATLTGRVRSHIMKIAGDIAGKAEQKHNYPRVTV